MLFFNQYTPQAIELFHEEPPPPNPDLPKFMQRQAPKIRAKQITCGDSASFAVVGEPYFCLYMWGITKKSGEAFMYPKQSIQVSGWRIRSVACGKTSTICSSKRTLITWWVVYYHKKTSSNIILLTRGPSPTYGELGYGSGEGVKKSSTVSKAVDDLEGAMVEQVAAGLCHSLAIVRLDDPKGPKIVDALPVFEPDEVQDLLKASNSSESRPRKKKKTT